LGVGKGGVATLSSVHEKWVGHARVSVGMWEDGWGGCERDRTEGRRKMDSARDKRKMNDDD
jgi:hypothetical protein